jgi:hypothetical protein
MPGSGPPDSPSALDSQPMPFHTLVLDLAGVCFVDLNGVKVLTKVSSVCVISIRSQTGTMGMTCMWFSLWWGGYRIGGDLLGNVLTRGGQSTKLPS